MNYYYHRVTFEHEQKAREARATAWRHAKAIRNEQQPRRIRLHLRIWGRGIRPRLATAPRPLKPSRTEG